MLTRLLLWFRSPAGAGDAELVALNKSGNPAFAPGAAVADRQDTLHRLSAMRSLKRHLGDRSACMRHFNPCWRAQDADFEVRSGALEITANTM